MPLKSSRFCCPGRCWVYSWLSLSLKREGSKCEGGIRDTQHKPRRSPRWHRDWEKTEPRETFSLRLHLRLLKKPLILLVSPPLWETVPAETQGKPQPHVCRCGFLQIVGWPLCPLEALGSMPVSRAAMVVSILHSCNNHNPSTTAAATPQLMFA